MSLNMCQQWFLGIGAASAQAGKAGKFSSKGKFYKMPADYMANFSPHDIGP